jgi:hypothetical protein
VKVPSVKFTLTEPPPLVGVAVLVVVTSVPVAPTLLMWPPKFNVSSVPRWRMPSAAVLTLRPTLPTAG